MTVLGMVFERHGGFPMMMGRPCADHTSAANCGHGSVQHSRLSGKRDVGAAKVFFRKAIKSQDRLHGPSHWMVMRHRIAPCAK
jgi:hypothetical protein